MKRIDYETGQTPATKPDSRKSFQAILISLRRLTDFRLDVANDLISKKVKSKCMEINLMKNDVVILIDLYN